MQVSYVPYTTSTINETPLEDWLHPSHPIQVLGFRPISVILGTDPASSE